MLIPYFRSGEGRLMLRGLADQGRLVLSSVVAQEVLAGARSESLRREYRHYFVQFEREGLAVAPTHEDWVLAGQMLSNYAQRWGAVDPAHHINDILIVLTARRLRANVISENARDMLTWARMLNSANRRVLVMRPSDFHSG